MKRTSKDYIGDLLGVILFILVVWLFLKPIFEQKYREESFASCVASYYHTDNKPYCYELVYGK